MPLIARKTNHEKTFLDASGENDGGFHFLTSEDPDRSSAQWRFRTSFNSNPKLIAERKSFFKTGYGYRYVALPKPNLSGREFRDVLFDRRSQRDFSGKGVTLEQVSAVLAGAMVNEPESLKRAYPSGGGRYPIEIYLINFKVSGLDRGVYHYQPKTHGLVLGLANPDQMHEACPPDSEKFRTQHSQLSCRRFTVDQPKSTDLRLEINLSGGWASGAKSPAYWHEPRAGWISNHFILGP